MFNEIEKATQAYAETRASLVALVTELNDEINMAKRGKVSAIRRAVNRTAEKHDALMAMLKDNQVLFAKPKTRVLHGVKVGFKKQPGAIEIADEAATLARIKKMFDEDAATLALLIKTTEKPVKDALGNLSGDQLKKLGVKVTSDTDKAIINPVDSEVDKIVDALLAGATEDE
jgi:phage host-nuclease inhibitor protein Gam